MKRRISIYFTLKSFDSREFYRSLVWHVDNKYPDWELVDTNWRNLREPVEAGYDFEGYMGRHLNHASMLKIKERNIPAVFIGNVRPEYPWAVFVDYDNEAYGKLAARFFIHQGFRSFAFCGSNKVVDSVERFRGFANYLHEYGYGCASFTNSDKATEEELGAWLKQLSPQTAILARNDIVALKIMQVCRKNSIRVPEDLAVLGIDNEDLAKPLSQSDLSSIIPDSEKVAERACDFLQQMFEGKTVKSGVYRVGPYPEIYKGETAIMPHPLSPLMQQALEWLRITPVHKLSTELMFEELDISRRTLERMFRKEYQSTPAVEIRRVKMNYAQALLRETDMNLEEIASKLDYPNTFNFSAAYKRFYNQSPNHFRQTKTVGLE